MNLSCGKRLRGITLLAMLLAGRGVCAQESTAPASEIATPQSVTAVRVISEEGTILKAAPVGLAVQVGQPLNPGEVATSLRTLYQTGDYADLRAVATFVGGGVQLDFIAKENFFINQVLIEG